MNIADHDRIPEIALGWHRAGKAVALATVVQTWGSAPRPVGAQLAISSESEIMGSVSGGCVEAAVVAEALDAIQDGTCRILEFGVSDHEAFAVGLACGGTIRVMVEPIGKGAGIEADMLADLTAARADRTPVSLVTDTTDWTRHLLAYSEMPARFDADRSGFDEQGRRFTAIHNPPLRLAIVGAAHIAQPLVLMAKAAGYDITLIDPREAFAAEARFPGERLVHDWPDVALAGHGLDIRTAVVALSHDPKLDDPALTAAIASPVFYIGALGSTRTHAKRVARLTEQGFSVDQIARIEAPIGLDIGAKSPAEIAIAILAQMTERLRRPETRAGAAMPTSEGFAA
ncbi:MAG: XdhC family protein [Pseudomonadota bacterium]